VLVFGLLSGWLSDVLSQVWILPVGLVLGMGAGIAAVWVRYGVHRP
jgi:F0F1-type ATP synthase assembly protein I